MFGTIEQTKNWNKLFYHSGCLNLTRHSSRSSLNIRPTQNFCDWGFYPRSSGELTMLFNLLGVVRMLRNQTLGHFWRPRLFSSSLEPSNVIDCYHKSMWYFIFIHRRPGQFQRSAWLGKQQDRQWWKEVGEPKEMRFTLSGIIVDLLAYLLCTRGRLVSKCSVVSGAWTVVVVFL